MGPCPAVLGLGLWRSLTAAWNRYEWIVWSEDGPDYRLRIRVDRGVNADRDYR